MFWYPVILMVLVTLEFVSRKIANVGPSNTFPKSSVTDHNVIHSGERALRSKSTETKDDERNNFTAEERAAILSNIKVWLWFERGRTNDFVLNKLGLERLSGEALTSRKRAKQVSSRSGRIRSS
ncbi:RxLR effector protein [Phytophthora megakarya]|uniref:RxLR effector protein n=1 Tax=Phytophthora megakarya TaxID=4795 RepID=A0A225V5A1_9STRA|nr:RxLR effector protein [Phytophthora megakarya]